MSAVHRPRRREMLLARQEKEADCSSGNTRTDNEPHASTATCAAARWRTGPARARRLGLERDRDGRGAFVQHLVTGARVLHGFPAVALHCACAQCVNVQSGSNREPYFQQSLAGSGEFARAMGFPSRSVTRYFQTIAPPRRCFQRTALHAGSPPCEMVVTSMDDTRRAPLVTRPSRCRGPQCHRGADDNESITVRVFFRFATTTAIGSMRE